MQNQPVLQNRAESGGSIPHLDGVRGMAIFLVATTHIFYEFYFSKIGWVGLNLFFILSGYLITRCLFQYKSYSAQNYFRNFYLRRILRIFPLYYAVLLFFFFLLPLIAPKFDFYYSELNSIQGYYWLFSSNWNIIWDGLPHQSVFFHFWSLAVEEQFYFMWPVLFLLCYNSKTKYILVSSLLVFSITTRIITEIPLYAYLSSLTAAEPLLLGCLLCILQEEQMLGKIRKALNGAVILSALILCFVFLQNQDLQVSNTLLMKYGYSAIDIILVSIIYSMFTGSLWGQKLRNFFSMKWLRWLGKYSYSIYVFHWIILQTIVFKVKAVLLTIHFPEPVAFVISRGTGIVLTLVISYYSYNYFEAYFLSLKKYFTEDRSWKGSFRWHYIFHRQTKSARS